MRHVLTLMCLLLCLGSCGEAETPRDESNVEAETEAAHGAPPAAATESAPADGGPDRGASPSRLGARALTQAWSGDLDGMRERRVVRVLTVYGLGRYFFDGAEERGATYEMFKAFEEFLNEKFDTGELKIHVVLLPVSRDELIPGLLEGRGDIAAAGLTITPERLEQVDFSDPVSRELREVLVTGPAAPPIESLDDLAGQRVDVRASSSYFASLEALSARLVAAGKTPIDIQPISELLEDEDLLEMVNNGLLPWMVVDDYKPRAMAEVFPNVTVREDLVLRAGGQLGYAFRKNSPLLAAALNEFVASNRAGTLFGNILINRYIRNYDFVRNSLTPEHYQRFAELDDLFRKYGEQYGFDYLVVAAQGYQESQLDQSRRSAAGAVGIMQLLPSTASDPNVGIPDIHDVDSNIHAGVRYLDFIRNTYFAELAGDRFNQTLLALAAYNAGPARVRGLRQMTEEMGLNPNVWFANVEVAAAREIGRETVQYVANIYKYYIAYRMTAAQAAARQSAREEAMGDRKD